MTAVQPPGRFGALEVDGERVLGFREKPHGDGGWINGGFFVLSPDVGDYLEGDDTIWEHEPLADLARDGQLVALSAHGLLAADGHAAGQASAGGALELRSSPLEGVGVEPDFWRGRRVLVTGHTGFKGSWLALWLASLGADVVGLSNGRADRRRRCSRSRGSATACVRSKGDVRDLQARARAPCAESRPEVVFHMAAQSLVRRSFDDPVETYATNVMGTVHVLDAARRADGVRVVVIVTSDKCYENREWVWGYREDEPMGGHDPYSSSKGVRRARHRRLSRSSYANGDGTPAIASARAGNVIGGGDWARTAWFPT